MQRTSAYHPSKGQGLVEFALILPLLLVMIFGIIDFTRVLTSFAMASNSIRDALRMAEIIGYADPNTDPGAIPPYADCQGMRNRAARMFFVDTTDITITYVKVRPAVNPANPPTMTPQVCSGASISPAQLQNGDILQISINRQVRLITPGIASIIQAIPIRISGQRTIIKYIPLRGILDPDDPNRDTDYDGLRDLWEELYFGNNNGTVLPEELYNNATDDPDSDGCNNGCEETRGTNPLDPDTDGDGLTDGEEAYQYSTDPTKVDTDGDGLTDPEELFTHGTSPRVADSDFDGLFDGDEVHTHLTNPFDQDSDDDGGSILIEDTNGDLVMDRNRLSDYHEVAVYGTNPNQVDTDDDGLADPDEIFESWTFFTEPADPDSDDDGLNDGVEVLGWTRTIHGNIYEYTTDPWNTDSEGDGLTDQQEHDGWDSTVNGIAEHFYADPNTDDVDADGVPDAEEFAEKTDPYNADTDNDGLSDRQEIDDPLQDPLVADNRDDDGDGLPDVWEQRYFPSTWNDADHEANDDPDGDGCDNHCEFVNRLDPSNPDTDGDGLPDGAEFTAGTNPSLKDTDGDTIWDGEEVAAGTDGYITNPLNRDTDGDTLTDSREITGWDGVLTLNGVIQNIRFTSNPTAATSDADSLDDKTEFNRGTNPSQTDSDGDLVNDDDELSNAVYPTDPRDDDSDNDTIKDGVELQTGCMNPNGADTDNDTWPDPAEYNVVGRDPCVSGQPQITVSDVTVTEGDSNAIFTISLTSPNGQPVTVSYSTANGTAAAGSDYQALSGSVTIGAVQWPSQGESITVSVPVTNDSIFEDTETFFLNLSGAPGATIVDNQGLATVLNNDQAPRLTINDVSGAEDQSPLTFTVTLSAVSGKSITVSYSTDNSTATASSDYQAASSSLTFAPGETSKQVTIALINDPDVESDETFTVNLSLPPGYPDASILDGQGVGTIRDNDGTYKVKVTFAPAGASSTGENIATGQLTFNVSLDRAVASGTVSVTVATSDGTAKAGSDYTAQSQTLTFAQGETSRQFMVNVTNDTWDDSGDTETMTVTLSNPSANAELVSGQSSAIGQILDDEVVPHISVNNMGVTKPNNGTVTGSLTVTLSHLSENTITVNFAAVGGESPQQVPDGNAAVSPRDYSITTGTPLTFGAMSISKPLTFTVSGAFKNSTHYFYVVLSAPTNATLSGGDQYGDVRLCRKQDSPCPVPIG